MLAFELFPPDGRYRTRYKSTTKVTRHARHYTVWSFVCSSACANIKRIRIVEHRPKCALDNLAPTWHRLGTELVLSNVSDFW